MGCSRACYLSMFLLDYAHKEIGAAMGRSRHTSSKQVQRAYDDLRKLGLEIRGKGDAATFLMVQVPPKEWATTPKRPSHHPLRDRRRGAREPQGIDHDSGSHPIVDSRHGVGTGKRNGNRRSSDVAADGVTSRLRSWRP
jgi:hypothetical protein